jgi:D-lactate dehydrogenase
MRVAVFSTKSYDRLFLSRANEAPEHDLTFFEARLTPETVSLGLGFEAICAFVNDQLRRDVLEPLAASGTRLIALRSAGFNNVDIAAADELGITVARVPAYSPHAVAEHAAALILTLNRKTNRAHNRVREGNFSLDGLLGFDLHGKTVGVVGTGKIGTVFARIMHGFGCRVLAFDPYPGDEARQWAEFVSSDDLLAESDVVALHLPLTPDTHHLINASTIARMKRGVMLINTSRGALVDTQAVIEGLKRGHIGYLGLDVYEEEEDLFFEDFSDRVIQDDVLMRLLTFPNVLITGHQAFFTREALTRIAETTVGNISAFEGREGDLHAVSARQPA